MAEWEWEADRNRYRLRLATAIEASVYYSGTDPDRDRPWVITAFRRTLRRRAASSGEGMRIAEHYLGDKLTEAIVAGANLRGIARYVEDRLAEVSAEE